MNYSPAELATFSPELRAKGDRALDLLAKYADIGNGAETYEVAGEIQQIARTFELVGFIDERDAIISAFKGLNLYVEIRCRHKRDAESPLSILNYYPEGHKLRRSYEVRCAEERRQLAEDFPTARTRILAKAGLRLNGTKLDATLAGMISMLSPRPEAMTAEAVVGAVSLREAVAA